jgi:hypothetical protein
MPIIINILPNIYWLYNNSHNPISLAEYKIELRKQSELLKAKTVIELDDKLTFWQKSSSYINEIKIEMEKNEFAKLLALLKKINNLVITSYTTNDTLIISTFDNKYLELGLAIWIYFFNINAGISFDNVIKLMGYKIIGNIVMSDEIKKFFAFLNINKLSGKI